MIAVVNVKLVKLVKLEVRSNVKTDGREEYSVE